MKTTNYEAIAELHNLEVEKAKKALYVAANKLINNLVDPSRITISSLSNLSNDIAACRGRFNFWYGVQSTFNHSYYCDGLLEEAVKEVSLHIHETLVYGVDDTSSGRGNDIVRVEFDAFRHEAKNYLN